MSHTLFDAAVYFKIWAMLKILTFPSINSTSLRIALFIEAAMACEHN